jgi:glycosyltransferase involved in cell wall biosynthesis
MGGANIVLAVLRPLLGRPVVWGLRASNMPLSQYDWASRFSSWAEARLAGGVDLIITNSEAGRRHALSQGFSADLLRVVENGFECHLWRRDPTAGRRFREAHGIATEAPLIGIVGRLDPVKGHAVFLRAAALFHEVRPGVRFAVVGSGPLERALKAQAAEGGARLSIHWIPEQSEMVPVYSALDALVSASWSEGFPNVVAEAMACGLRPVVTDAGDSSRVVGPCGWVVPPGDAEALGDAMARALDPESATRPDPRAYVETTFSVERLVDRTESLLQRVVG